MRLVLKRILELQEVARPTGTRATVNFQIRRDSEFSESLWEGLHRTDDKERLELTSEIFRLWLEARRHGASKETVADAKAVFGELWERERFTRFMFTLTEDGRQFRVWFSLPDEFRTNHVANRSHSLLVSVEGESEAVKLFVEAFVGILPLRPIKLPNGVTIWIDWIENGERWVFDRCTVTKEP